MIKDFIIQYKGYHGEMVESPISGIEMGDIKCGYNYFEFKGTEKQLDKFIKYLCEDESTLKVLDYFEKDSEEHNLYLYGPDNILKQ